VNPADALPKITEHKLTLAGVEKRFECRVLARTSTHLAVLWIAPAAMHVHGVDLPAGTVSVGHFWTDRPYNVYHWLRRDRATVGYYFNLADRTRWSGERLDWRDLTVDVLATPPPEARLDVLDEDELPADLDAEASAHIEAGKAALLRATAEVLAEVEEASRRVLPLASFAFTPERAP
jgi:predicted RNA-binding protein associated with RNAse of E/G family